MFPSTLTGAGSLPYQGLPHPVRSALRVSYPLSGLLLPEPLNHISGSSILGIIPFRVFFPSKSRVFLKTFCSLAVRPTALSAGRRPRLQSFAPFEELDSRQCCYTAERAYTLLGSPSLRLISSSPVKLLRVHFSFVLPTDTPKGLKSGTLEFFCQKCVATVYTVAQPL